MNNFEKNLAIKLDLPVTSLSISPTGRDVVLAAYVILTDYG